MFVIGEKINSTRPSVSRAIATRDTAFILNLASSQIDCGANILDVNCGTNIKDEPAIMQWLVKTVQEKFDCPLAIDSPNPAALEAGLAAHKGRALVNSITAEKNRFEPVLPLVKKYDSAVIALAIDENGMPSTAAERFNVAQKILLATAQYGIAPEDVFIDPLVRPVATEPQQVNEFLESLRLIKKLAGVKTVCGLSNVSFGLPRRGLLNATFLAMALSCGLDAAIMDPTDKKIVATIRTAEALLNRDEYCLNYITAHRECKLE